MSRRIASFWMLPSSKNKEVLHNCFVFDVVNFEKGLAELLRFWRCHVQTLRKSRGISSFLMLSTLKNEGNFRRIAVFLMLSTLKHEEVSRNSLVFKRADRRVDRQTDRQTDRNIDS